MDYKEFKENFKNDLMEHFGEQNFEFGNNEVRKVNREYEAITISPIDSNIGVNVSVNDFYDMSESDAGYENALNSAIEMIENGLKEKPVFNVDEMLEYEKVKDKLVLEVIPAEKNKELLNNIPHKIIEDLALIYRLQVSKDRNGYSTVIVSNKMLESYGITPEQLDKDAKKNAERIKPAKVKAMKDVLIELMEINQEEADMLIPKNSEELMYVASTEDKYHGAGIIAYDGFFEKTSKELGNISYWVIPSSIHEIIIVTDKIEDESTLSKLEEMVREVNSTEVPPEDILSYNVYHYDSKNKIFETGRTYEERKAS